MTDRQKRLIKILEIIVLILAMSTWSFSFFKIIQYLGITKVISSTSDVGVYVESSAQSQVSGGQGKASMSVTTEVNGDKHEVTSDKPGEIKITVENGKTTTEVNTSSPTPQPSASANPSPTPVVVLPPVNKNDNQIKQMENEFSRLWQDFLARLSQLFGF